MNYRRRRFHRHKHRLLRNAGGKCFYCQKPVFVYPQEFLDGRRSPDNLATRDHFIPRSKGGLAVKSNIVLACYACNQDKDDMDGWDYLDQLADRRRSNRDAAAARLSIQAGTRRAA